jgi:hypothetical protein
MFPYFSKQIVSRILALALAYRPIEQGGGGLTGGSAQQHEKKENDYASE